MQIRDLMDQPMIDFRLYRLAWIPAAIAAVILMFSFVGAPDAIEPTTPPGNFEAERAAGEARRIAESTPDRTPGSEGDRQVADLVAERFGEIPAGIVNEHEFETDFDGEGVTARNVWLTLPGDGASTIVVVAGRDSSAGAGAATSAAATGALIELASALGVSGHSKTFVLASTSGGAQGAVELLAELPEPEAIVAVIAIAQPGAAEPRAPYVIDSSTAANSGSVQLERTAELAVDTQALRESSQPGAFAQLARLAIPAGLGPQAPLVGEGIDAVTISSGGERPLDEAEAQAFSGETLDAFGRAVQSTISAVDVASGPLEHGPGTHLELSDNLVPGWTLSLLALTLLLPVVIAAIDGAARARRRDLHLTAGLAWAAARGLPLIGALAVLYGLTFVGLVPQPPFPFDPALFDLGARAWITLALIVVAIGLSAYALRVFGVSAARAPASAPAGLGLVAAIAGLMLWLANPYLALLVVPVAHVWLLATSGSGALRAAAVLAACVAACLPLAAALASVAGALDLGGGAPWTFVLMVADGQIGLAIMVAACFLGGVLIGAAALSLSRARALSPSEN
jgi:hypothetical protein